MYAAIKHRKDGRFAPFIIALVCVVYLVSYMTVGFAANNNYIHKPGTVEVIAEKADIIDCRGVSSEQTKAVCSGNVVTFDIIGISGPGTGAMARITATNTGTLDAVLVGVDTVEPLLDFMELKVADLPIGEVIKPGKSCIFDVGVYWDPARTDVTKATINDSFQVVLTYENNEMIPVDPNPNPSPKTGDNSHTELFTIIAIVCGVVLVICLLLMIFGKKKKEDDDNE